MPIYYTKRKDDWLETIYSQKPNLHSVKHGWNEGESDDHPPCPNKVK